MRTRTSTSGLVVNEYKTLLALGEKYRMFERVCQEIQKHSTDEGAKILCAEVLDFDPLFRL